MPEERETALSATSVDGLHFTLDVPVERLALGVGSYVVVGDGGSERLAYTTEVALDPSDRRLARVEGRMLDGRGEPFGDAAARPAGPDDVRQWLEAARPARAALEVGSLTYADGVPLALDAGAFDRHTFLCGQSGSGKTYALGTILERLLAETTLRVVVLDPNSDFVRLHELRDDAGHDVGARYGPAASSIDVRRAGADLERRLHVRFRDFDAMERAAVLRLDPINDREEYGALLDAVERADDQGVATVAATIEALLKADGPFRSLALRARNLGVDRWQVWSGADSGSLEELVQPGGPRCVVADLGSLETRDEQAVAAEALLAALWRRRAAREPVLIVIDEAHNVCPSRRPTRCSAGSGLGRPPDRRRRDALRESIAGACGVQGRHLGRRTSQSRGPDHRRRRLLPDPAHRPPFRPERPPRPGPRPRSSLSRQAQGTAPSLGRGPVPRPATRYRLAAPRRARRARHARASRRRRGSRPALRRRRSP